MREIYTEVFKPTCEKLGINCWRVDEIAKPGSITKDIVEGIIDSDFIIADLTGKNPNVFYELGIAHSHGSKTIMVCQSKEDIPFDIAAYRVVFYEHSITGCKALEKKLEASISELLHALESANNPVQEVLSQRSKEREPRKRPLLVEVVRMNWLGKRVRDVLIAEKIVYPEQLAQLNLESVREKYGLGGTTLAQLIKMILHFEAYQNLESIQEFVLKRKIDLGDHRLDYIFH